MDRGLAYAESCFETFRVVGGKVFARKQHQDRLQHAASMFGWSNIDVQTLFDDVIAAANEQGDNMLARLTLSGASAAWGILPNQEADPQSWLQLVAMRTTPKPALHLRSINSNITLRPKSVKLTADYADILRIYQQAHSELCADEQMLICSDKQIISSMTANVLLLLDGQWITPEGVGTLPGIIRQNLLDAAVIQLQPCPINILQYCSAMACINSGVFIQAVSTINGRQLNNQRALFQPLLEILSHQPGVPFICL